MKRSIIGILFVVALIVILTQPSSHNAFLVLLFLGIIPGTDIQLPFWAMAILFFGGGFLLLRWLGSEPLYIGSTAKQEKLAKKLARKRVTKKVAKKTHKVLKNAKSKRPVKKRSIRRPA